MISGMSDLWTSVAVGVAVPVILLVGPYLPYLLPRHRERSLRAVDAEQLGRTFSEGMTRGLSANRDA